MADDAIQREVEGDDHRFLLQLHHRGQRPPVEPATQDRGRRQDLPGRVERLGTVGPLTDPTSHGGRAEDAFDLVLPSLPGYGFSGEPAEVGWDPGRVAHAPNLTYFNEADKGGHFAAWEKPELFTEEIRAAFRSLR